MRQTFPRLATLPLQVLHPGVEVMDRFDPLKNLPLAVEGFDGHARHGGIGTDDHAPAGIRLGEVRGRFLVCGEARALHHLALEWRTAIVR